MIPLLSLCFTASDASLYQSIGPLYSCESSEGCYHLSPRFAFVDYWPESPNFISRRDMEVHGADIEVNVIANNAPLMAINYRLPCPESGYAARTTWPSELCSLSVLTMPRTYTENSHKRV